MLKVWITPGCPYVMKVLAFINDAKLQGQVEYIQDSPEQRKYVAEKAGKESSSFPAIELPDGSIIIISYLAEHLPVFFGVRASRVRARRILNSWPF